MKNLLMAGAEPFFFPGDRVGCLLVHGFTGTPKEMRWLGEYLHEQGRSVLGVRLAGHATRPEDMIRARWQDWVADLECGYHVLSGVADKIFVIGLSMGGILTLLFAADRPLAGVVVMSSPHHLPADPRLRFVKALSFIQRYNPKGPSDWHDAEAEAQQVCYPSDPVRSIGELNDLMGEMRAALPHVTAPVLLAYSHQDKTVRAEDHHMDLIYAALGSKNKEKFWVENSGHVVTRDADRQKIFVAVGDFVERYSAVKA